MPNRSGALLIFSLASLPLSTAFTASSAHAAPPTANVVASAVPPSAQWILHEVLPGELLTQIADRYAVSKQSLVKWNKLDAEHPRYRAGQKLRVYTQLGTHTRDKLHYEVRSGDSWAKIADHFKVPQRDLQHKWNHCGSKLRVGQPLVVWVEHQVSEEEQQQREAELPIVTVPGVGQSVGSPDSGYLANGQQLPENPALYTIRNPEHSFASSHTIEALQRGIADFRRDTGFARQLLIADMSVEEGGRFGPHRSHRSGRDVDIALPMKADPPRASKPDAPTRIDWTATWRLIKAFVATGEVRYIFLSRSRQMLLYSAAKADGASPTELRTILQYPRHDRGAIVRHAHGHTGHMHVRFRCGPEETACQEI
jgi:murein endopeptidase